MTEGCLKTTESEGYVGKNPGSPKVVSFYLETLEGITHPVTCVFSLALARPWLFEGFDNDGNAISDKGVAKFYTFPVRVNFVTDI